jgi:hypothetical protein
MVLVGNSNKDGVFLGFHTWEDDRHSYNKGDICQIPDKHYSTISLQCVDISSWGIGKQLAL